VELRVDELAARAGVSIDTIRFYQHRGLLDPPRRQGRVAWYGSAHLARLRRIRHLQEAGLSLATINRLLRGELDAADEALAEAVSAEGPSELLTLEELAERTGIPPALLGAVEREGLLVPRQVGGGWGYTVEDVDAARAGLRLLELGLPLPEVLGLARAHHQAVRTVAEQAVSLFDAHIRQPLRCSGLPDEEAAARLVQAFSDLLPATVTLVTHHFRRTLLAVAQAHIERVGDPAGVGAVVQAAPAGVRG
jgi:DNA-binding transcriptional MerR regulator